MIHRFVVAPLFIKILTLSALAIDIPAELQRADDFGKKAESLVHRQKITAYWSASDSQLIYRSNAEAGQLQFTRVNLKNGEKSPAFDPAVFARALAAASGQEINADQLPIDALALAADGRSLQFRAFGRAWIYQSAGQSITSDSQAPEEALLIAPEQFRPDAARAGEATNLTIGNSTTGPLQLFWLSSDGQRHAYGTLEAGKSVVQNTYAGHAWLFLDAQNQALAGIITPEKPSEVWIKGRVSPPPNKPSSPLKPEVKILNHNLVVQPSDGSPPLTLTTDGTADSPYAPPFIWSPDSKKLVAFRAHPVKARQIHIVQTSPPDQLQPKLQTLDYAKPGDPISQAFPQLFDLTQNRQIPVDPALFSNPWDISQVEWTKDSREFSFVYNQRGHQVLRLVGVDAVTGKTRSIVEDRSSTFIDYSQKSYLHRLPETREIIWASERDGYNHLYLIDERSGQVKNPITRGNWNVREVEEVDEKNRQLLLKVCGVPGQDPYQQHFIRMNFDGGDSTQLTYSDGNHRIDFSPGRRFFIDTWSRPDQPPVTELRRVSDGSLVTVLERADDSALLKTGWTRPERFVSKGRDGVTDIYGLIYRPTRFDPTKKYPVVEEIYAGPHDQFVTKSYQPWSRKNAMAEMGFIIVSIDGMGTNWRSKSFHDVAWKNLSDAGFPDRIPWIKAAAATRPWMDLSRVGLYGGSAGGQNALAGLLHHGDFYKVAVADCGCHDNRMDKIWWNEAWMGWPVDESYERNSNVTHAGKLTGKLLLIVGELDSNVDPASTYQVVSALQKADKNFEFLPIINANHGAAETPYGKRRRAEFLVRNLSE